jgi:hypothetical protein
MADRCGCWCNEDLNFSEVLNENFSEVLNENFSEVLNENFSEVLELPRS